MNWYYLGQEKDDLCGQKIDSILPVPSRIFYQTHFFPLLKMQGKAEEIYISLKYKRGAEDRVMVSDDVVVDPLLKSVIPLCHQICLKSMLAVRTSYQGNPNGEIGLQISCGSFDRKLLYNPSCYLW